MFTGESFDSTAKETEEMNVVTNYTLGGGEISSG